MSVPYTLTDRSLTVVVDNTPHSIPRSHPNWDKLITALNDNAPEEDISPLLNIAASIATFMDGAIEINERILSYQGKPLDNHLTRRIMQHMNAGMDGLAAPLMALLVKTQENPSYRAVQGLYEWLEKSGLPITEDGHIIAYKIVGEDYFDLHSHTFDHSVGNIIEQARNLCDEDPDQTCSRGLHFCSAGYLPHYGTAPGNRVVIVKIHPRDVIAFPRDYNTAKGRCCRMEVIGEVPRETAADTFGANLVYQEPQPGFLEGQIWKCRNGSIVTVSYIAESGAGRVYPVKVNSGEVYTLTGRYLTSDPKHDLDLVELLGDVKDWDIDPTLPVIRAGSGRSVYLDHVSGSVFDCTVYGLTERYDFTDLKGVLCNA